MMNTLSQLKWRNAGLITLTVVFPEPPRLLTLAQSESSDPLFQENALNWMVFGQLATAENDGYSRVSDPESW